MEYLYEPEGFRILSKIRVIQNSAMFISNTLLELRKGENSNDTSGLTQLAKHQTPSFRQYPTGQACGFLSYALADSDVDV